MGKHNAPKGTNAGNPDQAPGKHRAEPDSQTVMGKITRDMYEGVRGHVNDDTGTR